MAHNWIRLLRKQVVAMLVVIGPGMALAAPLNPIPVSSLDVFYVSDSGKNYVCYTPAAGEAIAGQYKSSKGLFIPYGYTLKTIKKAMRKTRDSKKSLKLKKKKSKLAKLNRSGNLACRANGSGGGTTPSPPTGLANFDFDGNVTEIGKSKFGIPSAFAANISRGKVVLEESCTCHEERINYTFPNLREKTKLSPMFFDENTLSNQALADLTAYLNRFRNF